MNLNWPESHFRLKIPHEPFSTNLPDQMQVARSGPTDWIFPKVQALHQAVESCDANIIGVDVKPVLVSMVSDRVQRQEVTSIPRSKCAG